jgi:selenocysteine lyase/cysteine desulfurase
MVSRRESLAALVVAPFGALAGGAASSAPSAWVPTSPRDNFRISGTYLNAAYTHPLPLDAAEAMREHVLNRSDPKGSKPREAKALFAKLVNADPSEIALIPSTSYGESFVVGALGLQGDRQAHVVTDILHFEGSLYTYGELAKQGTRVTVLPMEPDGRIDMNRLEGEVDGGTRLVAISLVSMVNGFQHDLKAVCEIAHRRGARVYVDAVQAAGAVPIDVKASGVDFLACSTFKWLMGDFGCGFLYVRSDLLPELKRREFGYHQPRTLVYHAFPGDPPGPDLFEAAPDNGSAMGLFEVGSIGTAAEIAAGVSLRNLNAIGVDNIQRARQPLMERLYERLSTRFRTMTPKGSRSALITFYQPDAERLLGPRLAEARINIQLYDNRFRISPSIYNTPEDIERVIGVLLA